MVFVLQKCFCIVLKIYLFSIIHAPKGDMFYRVIIEMNNADKSYLSVLKLTNSCTVLNLVKIFSNPATEKLNLTFTASVADMRPFSL